MRRFLFRIPAALLMVLGALCVVAGASWSIWQPRLLDRAAIAIRERTGVELVATGARPTLGGHIHVASLRAARGAVSAQCSGVNVQLGMAAALRGELRLHSVRIDRCDVVATAATAAPDAVTLSHDPAARLVPAPQRALDALDELGRHVGSIAIGTLSVSSAGRQATVVDLELTTAPSVRATGVLTATLAPLAVTDAPFTVVRDGDALMVSPGGSVEFDDAQLRVATLRWSNDGLTANGLDVHHQRAPVASVATFSLGGDRACPRVRIQAASVDLPESWLPDALGTAAPGAPTMAGAPAPDGEETANPVRPDSPDAGSGPVWTGESPGQQLLRHGGELARRLDAWMGELPTERCFELDVQGSTARAGRLDLTVRTAYRGRDGLLRADGRIGALDVRLDADGRRLEWAELAVSGIDLSRLLGGEAGGRTAGEVELGGRLVRIPGDELRFRGAVLLREAGLENAAISPAALTGINARLSIDSRVEFRDSVAITAVASGTLGGVPVSVDLALRPVESTHRLTLEGGVSGAVPCQSIWQAVPAGLVPNLTHEGVRFAGLAAPRLSVRYDLAAPSTFTLSAGEFLGPCTVEHVRREYDPRRLLDDAFVHHVTEGVTVDDVFVGPGSDSWVPIDAVPGYVPAAMYLSEEINFFTNPGISVGLINRGMRLNLERMRYAYGGSTVSQQLVKNLFLSRSKTLSRKLEEAVIVMALEQWVPKERILELYMNCIEFGPNLYGVGRAARHYFGVDASELTPLEAIFLANLKPSPLSGARHLVRGYTPETGWWPERTSEMLQRLVDYGGFIEPGEVAHYAPWVIALPGESGEPRSAYARLARPAWVSPKDRRTIRDFVSLPEPTP